MGGDTVSIYTSSIDDEQLITVEQQLLNRLDEIPSQREEENESSLGESDIRSFRTRHKPLEIEANERRIHNMYAEVFRSYDELRRRIENLEEAKSKILSYTPGSWAENVGGMMMSDYDIPKTTTLLLIGPKGSGKSSLVNRISRVFEDDKFAPERAQVFYNSSIGEGTCFLQEYKIPRSSTSFCLYDTRSFSNDLSETLEVINRWMTKGVCHGELIKMASDSSSLKAGMMCKARHGRRLFFCKRPMVNFVIFVVNGLSVLKCVESDRANKEYTEMVAKVFNSPLLSFKDHKPVIAITHGDLLSLSDRASVRVYLGDLLGVHPNKQTFDIPDNCEPTTELTIVDLLRYSLEHADRNLPVKGRLIFNQGSIIQQSTCLLVLLAVSIGIISSLNGRPESVNEPNLETNWKMIRHLWLGSDYEEI